MTIGLIGLWHEDITILHEMQDKNEVTVKLKPNISRNKCLSILRYGALPHRPTKGLSVFVCLFLPLAATTENLFGNL
ncbi:MAG: hypothetical protein KHW90_11725, partial [Clostridiales bacterium]|nr:hypothetical protein [Clostridiales bacterium]